jgi:hypothetical protein
MAALFYTIAVLSDVSAKPIQDSLNDGFIDKTVAEMSNCPK